MFLKKFRNWVFTVCAIAGLTLATLSSCTTNNQTPLRIGTIIWPGYELMYLARDLGYYDSAPIELIDFPSATEVKRAYLNGDIEGAALTLDEAIATKADGGDLQVLLVTNISEGGDVILGDASITELSQLKDKRIGVESTALGAYMLTRALDQANLKPADVEIVPVTFSEHKSAFQDGRVNAVITFEPTRSQLLDEGAHLLFDSTQIPGEIVDVLTFQSSVVQTQSETLQVLIDGWFQAYDYFLNNLADGAERMALRTGLSAEEFLESLELLHIPDLQENRQLLGESEASLASNAEQLMSVMQSTRLLDKPVDVETLFVNTAVEAVK